VEQEIGYDKMVSILPEGSSLVGYVRYSTDEKEAGEYGALVQMGSDEGPVFHRLGSATEIELAVGEWRDQVTFGVRTMSSRGGDSDDDSNSRGFVKVTRDPQAQLAAYRVEGEKLRQLIWDPIFDDLGKARNIFLVPDGSLNLVSFASLPDGSAGYLVEGPASLHYLTAEKSLGRISTKTGIKGSLVAVGGASYGGSRDLTETDVGTESSPRSSSPSLSSFADLPHAATEVQRIERIWAGAGGPSVVLTGEQATERNLKESLGQAQVVHLATHGFFLVGQAEHGGTPSWDNPLSRSGLALAQANGWQEVEEGDQDGLLTAQEVAALDLSGVQWAVLSACDTGLGDLDSRGEGVFGLRRAFALAGAETVVMSLWSVDDASTSIWVADLYTSHWQEKMPTSEAVRQASRKLIERRRAEGQSDHPYYWAGFLAAGDWR
jgi:CHAT domain-containing protein